MKFNWKQPNEKYYIFLIACCIGIGLIIGFFNKPSIYDRDASIIYDADLLSFRSSWIASINNDKNDSIQLPTYLDINKNDIVSISNILPAALKDGTYIAFKSTNAFVKVYIENELIYENTDLFILGNKTRPISLWNFIDLSEDDAGKTIRIVFTAPYSYYSGIVPEILIGTHSETLLYATTESSLNFQLSFSIVILGLLMFLFSVVSFTDETDMRAIIYLSVNICILGLMLFSRICAPYTELYSYSAKYLLMHFCLRIIPMTYAFYLILHGGSTFKKNYPIMFSVAFIAFLLNIILNLFTEVDFTATMQFAYIMMISVFTLGLYADLKGSSEKSLRYKILVVIGTGSLIVFTSLEAFTHIKYILKPAVDFSILGTLVFALFQMTAVLISFYEQTAKQIIIRKKYNENRIKLMISQIQPHFIYNALTTIRIMIKRSPNKAYKMIYDFSNYLSYNFNALEDVPLVPFSEELKHIETYTAIETERFFDRLKIIYDIRVDKFTVPPLSVQPYVENAIKHGICKKREGGTVTIKSFETNRSWVIQIIDDGVGFDPNSISKKRGIGLKNTKYRLTSLLGASIELHSELVKGTNVTITIPKKRRNINENDISR